MKENNDFWSTFTLRISIDSSLQKVYSAWSMQSQLETWFLKSAAFVDSEGNSLGRDHAISKGCKSGWQWHNYNGHSEIIILDANDKDFIDFIFGTAGNVKVSMKQNGQSVEVTLTQYDIPTDEQSKRNYHLGCSNGWTFWLANLKSWLEHGILLNVKGLDPKDSSYLVNS